mmetsp:Transcript_32218/g.58749  ORF Transcript_32218/g.58749 Transcript_32218/m.58749 type:complete len:255 (-) Transcript_32218:201-965(-)
MHNSTSSAEVTSDPATSAEAMTLCARSCEVLDVRATEHDVITCSDEPSTHDDRAGSSSSSAEEHSSTSRERHRRRLEMQATPAVPPAPAVAMPRHKDCAAFVSSEPDQERMTSLVQDVAKHYGVQACVLTLHSTGTFVFHASYGLTSAVGPPSVSSARAGFQFFCHNINRNLPTIIYDATDHSLAKDDVLVTGDQSVRFYACAPIIYGPGVYLGTLCILDNLPRCPFSLHDCKLLEERAAEVAQVFKDHESKVS